MNDKFTELKNKWFNEAGLYSDPSMLYGNRYYQEIIKLGEKVVPFLKEDLNSPNGDWVYALMEILKVNPIKKEHNGFNDKMKQDWVDYLNTR